MSNIFKCSRGFLIERREDGKFTPFFVKVRAVDIVDGKGKPIFPNGDTSTIDGTVVLSEKDDWTVRRYSNKFYEASTAIRVNAMYFTKTEGTDSELSCELNLPFSIFEDRFNVNVTMSGLNDALATSFINVLPIVVDGKVTQIKISLRNLSYTYPNRWAKDKTYDMSKVFINISGY